MNLLLRSRTRYVDGEPTVPAEQHDRQCSRSTLWHNPITHLARCTAGHLIDLSGEQS